MLGAGADDLFWEEDPLPMPEVVLIDLPWPPIPSAAAAEARRRAYDSPARVKARVRAAKRWGRSIRQTYRQRRRQKQLRREVLAALSPWREEE